jgi:hypothetical protein
VIITLRPHHVLCRLGYVGYGYSPDFIQEMARIVKTLESGRVRTIILRHGFDNICRVCPHAEGECSPEHLGFRGAAALEIDRRTLRVLKLKIGFSYPLPEINERIARLTEEEFNSICQGCEWQRLGACLQGQLKLRAKYQPTWK